MILYPEDFDGRDDLKEIFANNVVVVNFTKTNGIERIMYATLMPEFLPKLKDHPKEKSIKSINPNILSVWDVDKSGWRSFRIDNLAWIEFYDDDNDYKVRKEYPGN